MTDPKQAKRIKIMLLVVILLVLFLVLKGNKGSSGSEGGSLVGSVSGVNLKDKIQKFKDTKLQRDMVLSDKERFEHLKNELIEDKPLFWSYNKAGTPRGEAQQRIIRLGKDYGLSGIRVSIGTERNLPSCEYIKYIDYSISCRDFDMRSLAEFMEAIDKDSGKYYWKEMRVYNSGKTIAFSANLRIYVFNKKAVALLGK